MSQTKSQKALGGAEIAPPPSQNDDVYSIDALNASQTKIQKIISAIKRSCTGHTAYLWLLFASYVLCRSLDRIWFNRWMKEMPSYNWMNTAILFPVGVNFFMWCCLFYFRVIKNSIPKSKRDVSLWTLGFIASQDSLNSIIAGFATPFLTVSMQNVLQQSVLIFVMFSSYIWLKRRYLGCHYLGAVLTIYGIMVSVMGIFNGDDISVVVNGVVVPISALYVIIFIVSNIPAAASYTIKEKLLKKHDCNVYWFNAWIGFFQLLVGLATIPVVFIPMPEPATVISPSELGGYLHEGFLCFFGITSPDRDDECSMPWFWWILYSVFNIGFNILMTMMFKEASAVYVIIAAGAVMIVSSIMSISEFLVGSSAQAIDVETAYSLIITAISIVVYNSKPEKDIHGNDVIGVDPQNDDDDKQFDIENSSSTEKHMYPIDSRRRSSMLNRI
eukprot:Nk52_evm85s1444 gene=Nk52_evmTU85s1444